MARDNDLLSALCAYSFVLMCIANTTENLTGFSKLH